MIIWSPEWRTMDEWKHEENRRIMFRLLLQVHAYLKPELGTSCCVVLRWASPNNGVVHWTSLQSLICFVISGELQPTRLQLGSHSSSSSSPRTKTCREQRVTLCSNKGFTCCFPVWSFSVRRPTGFKDVGRISHRNKLTQSDLPDTSFTSVCLCLCDQIEPYLPYEFTCEGMLQRVNAFIENQVLPRHVQLFRNTDERFELLMNQSQRLTFKKYPSVNYTQKKKELMKFYF